MKLSKTAKNTLSTLVVGCMALGGASGLHAADGTWDGLSGGNWFDSDLWVDGTVADGAGSIATLPQFSPTAASQTITLDSDVTLGRLDLGGSWNALTSYNLNGSGRLIFAGGNGVTPQLLLPTSYSAPVGQILNVNVALSGTEGLAISGSSLNSRVTLNAAASDLSGIVDLTGSSTTFLGSLDALGDAKLRFGGTTNLVYMGLASAMTGEFKNDIILNNAVGTGAHIGFSSGASNLIFSGTISQEGGSRNIVFRSGTSAAVGRITVTGDNSYTGHTYIGNNLRLRIESDTALGVGSTGWVAFGATGTAEQSSKTSALELNKGVTVSNRTMTVLANDTVSNPTGTLVSVSGDNAWTGGLIYIGGPIAGDSTIGVLADQFTINALVASHNTDNGNNALAKVGDGVLKLTHANTYRGGTNIYAGWVLAANAAALGTGGVTLHQTGGLRVDQDVALRISSLNFGAETASIGFNLGEAFDSTVLIVTGNQTGIATYLVDIADTGGLREGIYRLLEIEGIYEAAGFALSHSRLTAELQGSLDWADGQLFLNVSAIPEPSSMAALFGVGALAFLCIRRKRRAS